ncbi:alpha-1,2-mannosyltransferase [Coprinopsis cinerea okayama7|uniref:Alpha-1,2-mannosyltransferase n=1 Tax=Coprinopsis cinerea (strain Okayama-7 / 130 / ATCC MYA-4618 / FGSC 9003) TaxID=240176 RepID=A8NFD4_COPC7|nr:alpha-1,2-mannosyltransferase [Coprinopsis cinerea okayama7\|eukprot:XP_001833256.2 alpha-1,2-mannosyltransferase [Coprinopsis cinerea okayama7\
MMTPMRYVVLVLGIIISLHFILSFTHESYGRVTGIDHIKDRISGAVNRPQGPPYKQGVPDEYYIKQNITSPQGRKANAVVVILARNGDINGVVYTMKQFEDRFNKKFGYPYVFLNDAPFDDNFKKRVSELTDAKVEFGLIPKDHWNQPDWIDEEKATKAREAMAKANVIYGGTYNPPSTLYKILTAHSGSLPSSTVTNCSSHTSITGESSEYREPPDFPSKLTLSKRPDVKFFCDLDYDPFLIMQDQKKKYGFTISLYEYEATIPTLWKTVRDFMKKHPEYIAEDNALSFISDDAGKTYNRCHFWSNFEIADLDLWRGEAYSKFFDFLDRAGGFYYERWGDAPVHSIGAALFAKKDEIHFFNDIGYRHEPFQHCPQGASHKKGKCWCDENDNFDYEWYSCLNRYDRMFN